jgi:hypothetical protein
MLNTLDSYTLVKDLENDSFFITDSDGIVDELGKISEVDALMKLKNISGN